MSSRQFPILPILALIAIGAGAYGLYKNLSFVEEEYEVGQSTEASRNRLLAAGFLLNTEGFEFEVKNTRRVFADLDKSDGVLWLTDSTELEDQREAEKILAWVESGGILLASTSGAAGFEQSTISGWFMEQLGIESMGEDPEIFKEFDESGSDYPWELWETITLPDADLENPKIRIFSDYDPYFQVVDESADNSQTIIDTPFFIHRAIGEGYVAVYADEELFDTDRLDEAEQGYLLLWVTQPAQSKNVSIVFRPASSPGLFTVLWNKFTLAICLLGLALAIFLRWAASRLGPIEQELPPIKNNIMAHLEARGEFWYRHKYTDKILANVQTEAQENMLSNSGKLNTNTSIGADEKVAIVKQASELLRCTSEKAEHILFGKARNNAEVLRMSRALQRLNHFKHYKPK